ncbi:GerW family sporulation protein [Methanolobus chelungpuianus]|uniref:Sporulation protein n=1 Tax=Methanolobus chelungpuianus TaxID=502115 RepID=A0AAE3HAD1_9EURY|nr:spore germination protein GerW family protein [Methanolobus chelungpuianus]MCQ6962489.1 sporulation protein [Methanolobus chelungpuianus]
MALEDVIKGVSCELERLVNTKTIIGEPIVFGANTIIPVSKVSFGFGTGGGEGRKKGEEEGFGGGGGAGAKIEPVAFIHISPDGVKLLPVSGKADIGQIIDSVPDLIDRMKSMKDKVKKGKGNEGQGLQEEECEIIIEPVVETRRG